MTATFIEQKLERNAVDWTSCDPVRVKAKLLLSSLLNIKEEGDSSERHVYLNSIRL